MPSGATDSTGGARAKAAVSIHSAAGDRPLFIFQRGLQVGQDRIETGHQRDQEAPSAFAIALAPPIAFVKATEYPADILAKCLIDARLLPLLAQVAGAQGRITVEAGDHFRDVTV